MTSVDKVRASRDGDQFHYHWAARKCLQLLESKTNLVAVTIEGSSQSETREYNVQIGDEVIDVGLYYGAENWDEAQSIRYIQLKHSTYQTFDHWTPSGLRGTLAGFGQRYKILLENFSADEVAQRFQFEFTTNRPISQKLTETLQDLASERSPRHPQEYKLVVKYTDLDSAHAKQFFQLFSAHGEEDDLWHQRNLLHKNVGSYLPEYDHDAPIQLKELVTRKATTEFRLNPSILRSDVRRALKTDEDQLQPAKCLIPDVSDTLAREQEQEILNTLLTSENPIVIHADGGVGKSVLAARLAALMPLGSQAILYDCFGNGLYRNSLHFRHRHCDALVQIANELAAQGLCYPLIPTSKADEKQYMNAFIGRLSQAIQLLRAHRPNAVICLIIDAADNAEMAAGESTSFVRDLVRTPLPEGIRIAFTCRTHRKKQLKAPIGAREIELQPFSKSESAHHLREVYPDASDQDVTEFAFLSSSNPRVQALALASAQSQKQSLHELLKQLGPEPTTVEQAISELLEHAIEKIKDDAGASEEAQIETICQALAVLRPLVPISILAKLSQTSESTIRDFALSMHRALLVKGNSLHFRDEPTETWFHEQFQLSPEALKNFIELLRPLTDHSSYAAAVLPQLLLQAGELNELVELALSEKSLPSQNPLERRNVELQRLTYALKACLKRNRYIDAVKLALKLGGESAGEQRQNQLIQDNTDIAAILMAPDRVEETVSRRVFGSSWQGSHHAYDAGLLSGREEFSAEASSRLRMAIDSLRAWANEQHEKEEVSIADIAEIAMVKLRLQGPKAATAFVRRWQPRRIAFDVGRHLAKRLIDLNHHEQLNNLAQAAGDDVWFLLGLTLEVREVGYLLPAKTVTRMLHLLGDRRIKFSESQDWNTNWSILYAVRSTLEIALRVLPKQPEAWAEILRRYLPTTPPSSLTDGILQNHAPLLRAYALEAALKGQELKLVDIAPPQVREQLEKSEQYSHSKETTIFLQEVGRLLPWILLSTEIICGHTIPDVPAEITKALEHSASVIKQIYRTGTSLRQTVTLEWLKILRDTGLTDSSEIETFMAWCREQKNQLWTKTVIHLCRCAARTPELEHVALEFGTNAYQTLENTREDAEERTASYLKLARAVLPVNKKEASIYFNHAIDIASQTGEENVSRWNSLIYLAKSAGQQEARDPQLAYRLSRVAELTYEYVVRDKYFDWETTIEALINLCPSSAIAILSRWRDRRFGDSQDLLQLAIYELLEQGHLPEKTPIAFAGIVARWNRIEDLKRFVEVEANPTQRAVAAQIAYRYIRVMPCKDWDWASLDEIGKSYGLDFPDIDRIATFAKSQNENEQRDLLADKPSSAVREQSIPDWDIIFQDTDMADADSVHSAYVSFRNYNSPYRHEAFFHEAFERMNKGHESELVRAISTWPDFETFKLRDLLAALPSPIPKYMALRNAIREAILVACRRQPEHAWSAYYHWGSRFLFGDFEAESVVSEQDIALATIKGFTTQLDTLNANEFFQLASALTTCLSSEEANDALGVGLALLEPELQPDDGDGSWSSELQPPDSLIASLAGYIWAGLGSPKVAERWQYAHVVRSIVELDWTELLEQLIGWAEKETATPFVDSRLDFYLWHAHQWLLIGLARGGLSNPTGLRVAIPLLQKLFHKEHVLIRDFAAQALRLLIEANILKDSQEVNYNSVNQTKLPEEVYTDWWASTEDIDIVPEESSDNSEKYYFSVDINPYWFEPLGRAFGLTKESIDRFARHFLRQQMGWNGDIDLQQDTRYTRNIFKDGETFHSHGYLPKTDNLCAYHGYHAMMMVAAFLLKERPVRRYTYETTDEFNNWLSDYLLVRADGKWLADRRDAQLMTKLPSISGDNYQYWRWSITAEYIDQQLLTSDGLTVFWGEWRRSSENDYHETVSVRSALVSRVGAEALVAALQTAPELGQFYLPSAGDENLETDALKLKGWVEKEQLHTQLDAYDPWAEGLNYPPPVPSDNVMKKLGLIALEDERSWTAGDESLIRSETWTHTQGIGQEKEDVPGWRLSGNETFLRHLHDTYPENCLILSVRVSRETPRLKNGQTDFIYYPNFYIRYYLIGEDGVPHTL